MKMQNALTSPIHGIVTSVHVQPGQTVEGDALLVVLQRPEAPAGVGEMLHGSETEMPA
jgi:hypothetical protein